MRKNGKRRRKIRTVAGPAGYERTLCRCSQCGHYFSPVDRELGVSPGLDLTPTLLRKTAWFAARSSYNEASQDLKEALDVDVSPAEFARVAQEEGRRFDQLQRAEDQSWLRSASPQTPARAPELECKRLVVQADATCVLTVRDEEHKSAYCGKAFGLEHRIRKDASNRPMITDARYTASGVNMEDFGHKLKALANRCGLRRAKAVAFMGDGAACFWKWAQAHMPKDTVLIQDFWHVCEHLAALAQELFGQAWRERFTRWKEWLRRSGADTIIAELKGLLPKRRGRVRKRLEAEITNLRNGRERMAYARYEREGWPLGSGAIEGACKHLVKQRFCVTGAQWRRANIPQMLSLRVSQHNQDWDKHWAMSRAG